MAGWADLPNELRLTIWEDVAADFDNGPPNFSGLATICRDWQQYFETRNFASLTLGQDDIADFERIVQSTRLSHIRYLRLHINLPEYDCAQSQLLEGPDSAMVNEIIFTNALCYLMDIIATCETGLDLSDEIGFTLELSASSISDGKHAFRSFRLSEKYEKLARRHPDQPDEPFMQHESNPFDTSLVRGCTNYHMVDVNQVRRVHGCRPLELRLKPTGLQGPKPPRVVNMVTGLLTRRQYYRSISTSALSFLTRNCFPRIVNLRIERWQRARLDHSQADGFLKELLDYSISRELQSLDIFEDRQHPWETDDPYTPVDDLAVSGALWRVCHMFPKLVNFSACSVIDARDFFSHFSDSFAEINPWPELKTLCLTAQDLMQQLSARSFQIEFEHNAWKLLTSATKVANLMPKLEVLELWHTGRDVACIWTYYKAQDHARLVVRDGDPCTELRDQPDGVQRLGGMAATWANYASELLDRTVTCELLLLPLGCSKSTYNSSDYGVQKFYSPRDIVQHLELAGLVLHPTTLHQMKWESDHDPHIGEPLVPEPPVLGPALPQEAWEVGGEAWYPPTPWGAPVSVGADTGDDQSNHGGVLWEDAPQTATW